MRLSATLLTVSLVINFALLLTLVVEPAARPHNLIDLFSDRFRATRLERISTVRVRGNVETVAPGTLSAHLPRFWATLDSDDLGTLVAHLRAAGFSPTQVRSIVSTRMNPLFASRIKALAVSAAETPFWRTQTVNGMTEAQLHLEINQIYRDRTKLMRDLLGNEYYANGGADPQVVQHRQFGDLPAEKIAQVQRIADDYAELNAQIRADTQGVTLPEDREKLAFLAREKHTDLAGILTPAELDDYEMHTSSITSQLRNTLDLMDASGEEFLKIYRTEQPQIDVLYPTGNPGPDGWRQRTDAQKQLAGDLKAALGEARYADFARASNWEFQQLARSAETENIPATAAVAAFSLRDSVTTESLRIYDDPGQSNEQKRAALQTLALNTRAQIMNTLGPAVGKDYVNSASWLSAIGQGQAVSLGADGNSWSAKGVPTSRD